MRTKSSCDLCGSKYVNGYLDKPVAMTSDSEPWLGGELQKVICSNCGLVRNKYFLGDDILTDHYENNYELSSNDVAESKVYDGRGGFASRSQIIYEWITDAVSRALKEPHYFNGNLSILEIGCSEGLVLEKMQMQHAQLNCVGLEPNKKSVMRCLERGLNVKSGFNVSGINEKYEFIYSVAVLEHVQSPKEFLLSCARHLTDSGYLAIIIPIMDLCSYDLYFTDHLFHFNSKHLEIYGSLAGLELIEASVCSTMKPFKLFLYKKIAETPSATCPQDYVDALNYDVFQSVVFYESELKRMDSALNGVEKVIVYGSGEKYSFFNIYSSLSGIDKIYIDDNIMRYKHLKAEVFSVGALNHYHDYKWLIFFNPDEAKRHLLKNFNIQYEVF